MSFLKKTNIALVGIGTIGKRHHMAIEKIENVKNVFLCCELFY